MDNLPKFKKIIGSSGRIILLLMFITRFFLTVVVFNKYVVFASVKEVKKGGTFLEAIYEPISYLPYWGDPSKNSFYQTMLFPGCIEESSGNLCSISSEDEQNYIISAGTGLIWSDGYEFNIQDILYTYKTIVSENIWKQTYLNQYKDIEVSLEQENKILVKFPAKTNQNKDFFSLPILPRHIIENLDITTYVEEFSKKPITVGCSKLASSNDVNSMVIDLSHCENSNINYYQIKSYPSYENFLRTNQLTNKNTASFYQGPDQISGYSLLPIIDNTYISLFFNTTSKNISPRIQRALGGLLYNSITKDKAISTIIPYTGLFANHQSDGTNVNEFISSKNPKLNYDRQEIEQAGVKPLPENININDLGGALRQSYYFSKTENNIRKLAITSPQEIQSINGKIEKSNKALSIQSSSNKKTHTIKLGIEEENQINEGVNTIIIRGNIEGKTKVILTIDLYYLGNSDSEEVKNKKLTIIHYNDTISNQIITSIKQSLAKANIKNFFEIKNFDDINSFASEINNKKYDIVLTPLSMNSPVDIAAIITNDDTQKNPSSYQNIELAKLLEVYDNTQDQTTKEKIIRIFGTDMPFVILGQITTPYRIRENINLQYTGQILLKDLKNIILSQANIVSHMNIRGGKLLEKETLINFIQSEHNDTL